MDFLNVRKEYIISLLSDVIPIAILVLYYQIFITWLINKNATLGIYSVEDFEKLITANPDKALVLFQEVKTLFTMILIFAILLIILLVVLYVYSRRYLWKELYKNISWKKWLGMFPIVVMGHAIYVGFILLIFPFTLQSTIVIFIIQTFIITLYVLLLILLHYSLVRKKEVWASIGTAFSYLSQKNVWKLFGIGYVVVGILNILLYFFSVTFPYLFTVNTYLPVVLFLLFIAWFRVYLVDCLKN